MIMTAMTMTNTATYKKETDNRRLSLMERFKKYFETYGAQIACGLLSLNGDFHAYKLYTEMTSNR